MPAESPQEANANPFLSTAAAVEVLTRLGQGLGARKPLLVLTGESGMGKTPLAREALRRIGERASIAWMVEPHLVAKDVPATLLGLFGATVKPGTVPLAMNERLLETLANVTAGGRVALLVVDDAHLVGDDVLVELQRIADRSAGRQCPLEILLVGQPALATRLAEPGLSAVNDQVSHRFELAPLNAHLTRRHLLLLPALPDTPRPPQFSRKACRDIHTASRGIPRDIEAIAAESARRAAKADSATVSPEHVREAVRALKLKPAPRASSAPAKSLPAAMAAASAEAAARAQPASAEEVTTKTAPREQQAKPEPAKAEANGGGSSKTEVKKTEPAAAPATVAANANGTDASPSGEFTPSNDPRVKDWVARFGGSGVRLGGFFTGPVPDEPVEEEIEDAVEEMPEPVVEAVEVTPAPVIERVERPGRGRTRELVGAGVSPAAAEELVNWPPRATPAPSAKGPVLSKRSSTSLGWPAVALLLAIALGGLTLAQRRMLMSGSETETNPVDLVPQTESVMPVPPAPGPATPSRATDAARSKATPREPGDAVTKPNRRARGTSATIAIRTERDEPVQPKRRAAADAPPAGTRYTVIVGSFLKPDMAWAERDHLSRLTNYPVWVSRRQIDGVRTYRIILGAFESTEIAETTAQNLLQRGLLRDAKVAALPLAP